MVITVFLFVQLLLNAANVGLHHTSNGIELRNERVSICLSNSAELVSFVDLKTDRDIAAHNHKKIASVTTCSGKIIEASRLTLDNDIIHLMIENTSVDLRVEAFDDYFTVEVQNKDLPGVEVLTFMDLPLNYDYKSPDAFIAAGVALTLQTNHIYYPSGESKEVVGRCMSKSGFARAKLAIVASTKLQFWRIVRDVYYSIQRGSLPVVYSSGGPFAQDSEANRYDCVIIYGPEVSPSKISEWIDFYYKKMGIRQFDFHHGTFSFIQGECSFPVLGSTKAFKEQIADPLYSEGIISTLHSYSYYIDYSANEILSNPNWQQQLEFREIFPLDESITSTNTEITVVGCLPNRTNDFSFTSVYSPYLLIDNEIIRYRVGDKGFVSCKRGQCGTTAVPHKKGSIVKMLGGYYCQIAPQIGSELYYEIARRTAEAYNKGGFRGIYFDAIDGLGIHLKNSGLDGYTWYYGAAFVNEVLKYCQTEPLVIEYSDLYPSLWAARGRGESWDRPKRGYKYFIDRHSNRNKSLKDRQYSTTMGWFDFYPVNKEQPDDYATKYMFTDDVDYLGVKAIAYDHTMTYEGLLKSDVEAIPGLRRNLDLYSQYNSLRMSNYFKEGVINVLRTGDCEYKLMKKNGIWGFNEVVYKRVKLRDISKDVYIGTNPYKKQKPFIRLENLYSSNCTRLVRLMGPQDLDGLNGKKCEKSFSHPLNLKELLGLKVTLQGNGKSSNDAICIRLRSAEKGGYADYVVWLNFDGTREIILTNTDNAEYRDLYFPGIEDNLYLMHRKDVDFTKVKFIQVYKSSNCKKINVLSIDAVPLVSNILMTPTLTLDGSSVTFKGTLQSGEYLEYNVDEKKAIVYDNMGNTRTIKVIRKGRFIIPEGDFTASVSGVSEYDNMPIEVSLTLGLYGSFIHN